MLQSCQLKTEIIFFPRMTITLVKGCKTCSISLTRGNHTPRLEARSAGACAVASPQILSTRIRVQKIVRVVYRESATIKNRQDPSVVYKRFSPRCVRCDCTIPEIRD